MPIPHFRPGTDDDRFVIPELVHQDMYRIRALAEALDGAGGTVLDCGAHIGVFAVTLAAAGVRQPIEAFEPEPANYALLVRNAAAYPTITPRPVAVGVRDEERTLYDGGETGRWSFTPPNPGPGRRGVPVRVIDLYRHIRDLGRVALLKLDLEGYEAELLNRMPDDVLARVGLLLTEEHHLPIDHARLAAAGFELWFHPRQDPRQPRLPPGGGPGMRLRRRAVAAAVAAGRGLAGGRRRRGGPPGAAVGAGCPAAAELLPASAVRVLDLTGEAECARGAGADRGRGGRRPGGRRLRPGPGGFDAVVCGRLLERVRDPDRLLRRARRAGCGPAAAWSRGWPTRGGSSVAAGLLRGAWHGGAADPKRIRFFTRREVEKLFFRRRLRPGSPAGRPGRRRYTARGPRRPLAISTWGRSGSAEWTRPRQRNSPRPNTWSAPPAGRRPTTA